MMAKARVAAGVGGGVGRVREPPPVPTFPQVLLVTPTLLLHFNDETFVATKKLLSFEKNG